MAEAPEFAHNRDRIANRRVMIARLNGATAQRSKVDLLASCEKVGVPAGPINSLDEVMADPQIVSRGMQIELDGVPGIRAPFRFSDSELALHRPAPKLGEDSASSKSGKKPARA